MAIKIVCKKKAPTDYLTKFMPREIDSLNATCRHHNVVGLLGYENSRQLINDYHIQCLGPGLAEIYITRANADYMGIKIAFNIKL